MKIIIELVGHLKSSNLAKSVGKGELEIDDGATLGRVLQSIGLDSVPPYIVAVGDAIEGNPDRELTAGDLIRIIPRVGGG